MLQVCSSWKEEYVQLLVLFRSRIQEIYDKPDQATFYLGNRKNCKEHEMQCHALRASVPMSGGNYQKLTVLPTPLPSSERSSQKHVRWRGWKGWCWYATSTMLQGREVQQPMSSLWRTQTYPTRISIPHRGWFRSLRREQKNKFSSMRRKEHHLKPNP